MFSNGDQNHKTEEIQEEISPHTATSSMPSQSDQSESQTNPQSQKSFFNFLKSIQFPTPNPSKPKFTKFTSSPSTRFLQFAQNRDTLSRSIHSSNPNPPPNPNSPPPNPNPPPPNPNSPSSNHPHLQLLKNIDWPHVWSLTKTWFKDPFNLALFIWILCVAISGAILFLVMTGMLNHRLRTKAERNAWFEVNNQILNALFTLMCLYQHPKRIYHFILLVRYNPKDVLALRNIYCKNGTYKPNEWLHIMVVVFLLNLNCFAQYALCGLNLGYPRSKRPAIGVGICVSVAIAAPAFAGLYNAISPLGKDYDLELDQEAQKLEIITDTTGLGRMVSLERRYSFVRGENVNTGINEDRPVWVGGILDFWDDISLAYLSVFCSCCVFGWNMQRLGFGNMYVHIVTFILFCSAPFFIFNLAAVNINNETLRESLGMAGIVLCFLGLLYGGFWRIQMRKRFKLPGSEFFCFGPSTIDCVNWLCCCWCSLAQEVRTADYYEMITDDRTGQTGRMGRVNRMVLPLPVTREKVRLPHYGSGPSSPYLGRTGFEMESPVGNNNNNNNYYYYNDNSNDDSKVMKAPDISVIERKDEL
ncbi:hypothetical protein LUZ60_011011 [Juncus effusus]|nr:hypothetical protein LUZ60_011011 [Juncus effusus]